MERALGINESRKALGSQTAEDGGVKMTAGGEEDEEDKGRGEDQVVKF